MKGFWMIYCLSLIFSICLFSLNVAMETNGNSRQVAYFEEKEEALLLSIVSDGCTVLMVDALTGNKSNLQLSLDDGDDDLNWRNRNGHSALSIAIKDKKEEIVQLFLAGYQAEISPIDINLAEESDPDAIKSLVVAMDISNDYID